MKTEIILTFDTEDYTPRLTADASLDTDFHKFLKEHNEDQTGPIFPQRLLVSCDFTENLLHRPDM